MTLKGFSDLLPELFIWEDISVCDETWANDDDITRWFEDSGNALVEQVGFVVYEDNDNVVICESFIEAMELYGNVTKVPKSVIRKRIKLIET